MSGSLCVSAARSRSLMLSSHSTSGLGTGMSEILASASSAGREGKEKVKTIPPLLLPQFSQLTDGKDKAFCSHRDATIKRCFCPSQFGRGNRVVRVNCFPRDG